MQQAGRNKKGGKNNQFPTACCNRGCRFPFFFFKKNPRNPLQVATKSETITKKNCSRIFTTQQNADHWQADRCIQKGGEGGGEGRGAHLNGDDQAHVPLAGLVQNPVQRLPHLVVVLPCSPCVQPRFRISCSDLLFPPTGGTPHANCVHISLPHSPLLEEQSNVPHNCRFPTTAKVPQHLQVPNNCQGSRQL